MKKKYIIIITINNNNTITIYKACIQSMCSLRNWKLGERYRSVVAKGRNMKNWMTSVMSLYDWRNLWVIVIVCNICWLEVWLLFEMPWWVWYFFKFDVQVCFSIYQFDVLRFCSPISFYFFLLHFSPFCVLLIHSPLHKQEFFSFFTLSFIFFL